MSRGMKAAVWIGAIAVFLVLLYVLSPILLPFVLGMAVAYFLDPVADRFERWGWPRWLAATVLTIAFIIAVVVVLLILVPMLQQQIVAFLGRLPTYVDLLRERVDALLQVVQARLSPEEVQDVKAAAARFAGSMISWFGGVLAGVWSGGVAVLNILSLVLITPVVAWYFLRDWDRMVAHVDSWLPRANAATIRDLVRQIDERLAGFVRGQIMVCMILGLFYGVALSVVGLDFGLVVGLAAGAVSFIPYFGAVFGLVLSVGIALAQFGTSYEVLIVAAVFFVGQAVEGNVISPRLVGDRVGLHPVWMIFALLAGGALFGFVGVLLSVPAAAAIGVLARFAIARYRASDLYTGGAPPP